MVAATPVAEWPLQWWFGPFHDAAVWQLQQLIGFHSSQAAICLMGKHALPGRWKHLVPPKCRYQPTNLHTTITLQKFPHPTPKAQQLLLGQSLLIIDAAWSYSDTPQSVELLWTSDQRDTETSSWQHTTPTRDRLPRRRDSNTQSQQGPRLLPRGIVPTKNNKKKFQRTDSRKAHTLKCHHRFFQNQFHFTSLKDNFFRAEFDIVRPEQAVDIVHTLQDGRPRSGDSMGCKGKRFKSSPNFPESV